MEPEEVISRTDGITDDHLAWELGRRETERLKSHIVTKFRIVDPQGTGTNVNHTTHTFETYEAAEQALPGLLVGLARQGIQRNRLMLKIEKVYTMQQVPSMNSQVA